MSTSPSWFDQEKFSRLVKKVGPKSVTEPLPSPLGAGHPAAGAPDGDRLAEGLASTARISLVSKPSSLLAENRALPALPRRSAPLPSLKPIFAYPPPTAPSAAEEAGESGIQDESQDPAEASEQEALAETWQKMSLLNEELARAIHERDEAIHESATLKDQLREAKQAAEKARAEMLAPAQAPAGDGIKADLDKATSERDEAVQELKSLRDELEAKKREVAKDLRSTSQSQELKLLTEERDRARKEYAAIRQQYEDLKKEQSAPPLPGEKPATKTGSLRLNTDKLIEDLKVKLAERDKEIADLKEAAEKAKAVPTAGEDLDAARQEIGVLKEQLAKAKDEASVAQRGLALSQKALHDTRDALREATEGTSLSRHNFDNLKNECATLSQQNAILQAKIDQLTKDLSATKKLTGRM